MSGLDRALCPPSDEHVREAAGCIFGIVHDAMHGSRAGDRS